MIFCGRPEKEEKVRHLNRWGLYGTLVFVVLIATASIGWGATLKGQDQATEGLLRQEVPAAPEKKRNMLEFYGNREAIDSGFGNWDSWGMRYTRSEEGYSYYFELNGYNRDEGAAGQIVGGLYKDWSPWLYTFTSMSGATNVDYVPKFRVDHDFNFKFGEKKNWVWTLGFSYIDYFTPNADTIYSTALTYYGQGIIGTYRFFYNISDPGSLSSTSHSFSIDQGYWYKYMNTLIVSWGNQAYMAMYLDDPSAVARDSWSVLLRHRRWLQDDRGFWVQLGALGIKDGYNGFNFGLGWFYYF